MNFYLDQPLIYMIFGFRKKKYYNLAKSLYTIFIIIE